MTQTKKCTKLLCDLFLMQLLMEEWVLALHTVIIGFVCHWFQESLRANWIRKDIHDNSNRANGRKRCLRTSPSFLEFSHNFSDLSVAWGKGTFSNFNVFSFVNHFWLTFCTVFTLVFSSSLESSHLIFWTKRTKFSSGKMKMVMFMWEESKQFKLMMVCLRFFLFRYWNYFSDSI